jgi:XTP/dITP diphosphohydrolase
MRLLIATSNAHKIDELRGIFGVMEISVEGLGDAAAPAGGWVEPDETGRTFAENARIKAVSYARQSGRACLADDSGLEVDALGGLPGVDSAYYAGREGSRAERDARNNLKLLEALMDVPDEGRAARYVCCICVARPDGGIIAETRGTYEGRIGRVPRGNNGFGYDPLFVQADGRAAAELTDAEKNARSHRGNAARALAALGVLVA